MRLFGGRGRPGDLPEVMVRDLQPDSVPAEMFRTLRTNIQFSLVDKERISLIVTSPLAEEGKTLVACHLGAAFARAGNRVFVVDADFRHPSVHRFFGQRNDAGLAEVLLGDLRLSDGLKRYRTDEEEFPATLYTLPTGRRPPNPAELLGSQRMDATLTALSEAAEVVILDCPPIVPVTDAGVLAPLVDGILLVTASGVTRRNSLVRAVDLLSKSGANLLGVALNFVPAIEGYGYYSQYPVRDDRPAERPA